MVIFHAKRPMHDHVNGKSLQAITKDYSVSFAGFLGGLGGRHSNTNVQTFLIKLKRFFNWLGRLRKSKIPLHLLV